MLQRSPSEPIYEPQVYRDPFFSLRRPSRSIFSRFLADLLVRLLIVSTLPSNYQAAAAFFPVSVLWPLVSTEEKSEAPSSACILETRVRGFEKENKALVGLESSQAAESRRGYSVGYGESASEWIVFTGYQWDRETDLYNAKARFYSPTIGRFISQDTFLGNIDDPPSLHRYFYVRNAPTKYIDPLGLFEWDQNLGGNRSDDDLRLEAAATKDKKERKSIEKQIERREAFRDALQASIEARDALPPGEDRDRLTRAIEAYGPEGTNPKPDIIESVGGGQTIIRRGMFVSADDPADARVPAVTSLARMDPSRTYDPQTNTVNLDYSVSVKIRPGHFGASNELPDTVAHEGSHGADYQRYAAALVTEVREGVRMDPVTGRRRPVIGDPTIDITTYETEREAYRVSASVAEGRYAINEARRRARASGPGSTTITLTPQTRDDQLTIRGVRSGHTIWDASWDEEDRAPNRNAAIDRLLAEPGGVYYVTPTGTPGPGRRLSGELP